MCVYVFFFCEEGVYILCPCGKCLRKFVETLDILADKPLNRILFSFIFLFLFFSSK